MWADWETMPLMEEDTLESVRQLRELGQVFIVTVRQGISDTLRVISWLNKQQIGMDGFLFSTFASGWDKARFSFFDVIIDDAPAAIIGAIERGKIGVVYTHPWNLDLPPEINSKAIRVSSLRDAVKELKKL